MVAAALIGVAFAGTTAACARPPATNPPTHEALVTEHMQGNYAAVLRWCPMILADRGADPAQSSWCLFGYPAALRLTLDTEQALKFIGRVCTDTSSAALADPGFRTSYVREVARWYALPMRLQRQDRALARGLPATVAAFSEACQVDPVLVSTGLDTALPTRRLAR
ncbi:hypothetical protein DB30_05406 [Enhygromyxa salina]|uniref:Lipoprotein n=1 Tax=Enhygromyxa salina TaxID=215803 RepID=A0A0C1ZX59_9BACT|nr:hypothetical protein [Enhygromyxa salina]KIG15658.1 hypothetical protein DB30_05406 [Enhygromyxa salina]